MVCLQRLKGPPDRRTNAIISSKLAMPNQLFLLRHGKSSWRDASLDDFDRPLKKRGCRDARNMGLLLRDLGWIPDVILSSSANRAQATTLRLCRAMACETSRVTFKKKLYFADLTTLFHVLRRVPEDAARVLLVGHNPDLEELTHTLSDTTPQVPPDGKLIPTATLVQFECRGAWSELNAGSARLVQITRPHGLVDRYSAAGDAD